MGYGSVPPAEGPYGRGTRAGPVTRALDSLSKSGSVGREVAWRLDLGRAVGTRSALRHVRPSYDARDAERRWASFYRWMWERAAEEVGAHLVDLGSGFLSLRQEGRAALVWQSNVTLDSPVTIRLALDKPTCSRLIAEAGVPVPEHLEFDDGNAAAALSRLRQQGGSWVVKPANGTGGGQGVTCGVTSSDDLVRACIRARRWSHRIVMERQLQGDEYRVLLLDAHVLDVIRRRPPVLVGDGHSSVERLIALENERRRAAQGRAGLLPVELDLDTALVLRAAGLTLRSVPPAGQEVRVKTAANSGGSQDTETVRDLSPHVVEMAARAARVTGVRLAGVDVIVTEPSTSCPSGAAAVVEVNALPGLHYHYLVRDPAAATPVAVPILRKILREALPAPQSRPQRRPASLGTARSSVGDAR